MNSTNQPRDQSDADATLDRAIRQRRRQQLAERSEPSDSATGTSEIAARLAKARAEALTKPRVSRGVIDLS